MAHASPNFTRFFNCLSFLWRKDTFLQEQQISGFVGPPSILVSKQLRQKHAPHLKIMFLSIVLLPQKFCSFQTATRYQWHPLKATGMP